MLTRTESTGSIWRTTALKRLASAVRFRPWPPFLKHLRMMKNEFGSKWFQIQNRVGSSGLFSASGKGGVVDAERRLRLYRCRNAHDLRGSRFLRLRRHWNLLQHSQDLRVFRIVVHLDAVDVMPAEFGPDSEPLLTEIARFRQWAETLFCPANALFGIHVNSRRMTLYSQQSNSSG